MKAMANTGLTFLALAALALGCGDSGDSKEAEPMDTADASMQSDEPVNLVVDGKLPTKDKCGAQPNGKPGDSSSAGGCYYFYCYQTKETLLSEATQGGACANAIDTAVQCEGTSVRTVSQCARTRAGKFAEGGAELFRTAVTDCARDDEALKDFSDACLACNVESSVCAAQKCLLECVTGDTPGCDKCREDNGCTPDFYACAGLPDPNK